MTTPVFLHIFETERECLHEMSELFEFFQYYPDTTIDTKRLEIRTPVMLHLFRTEGRLIWGSIDGLNLVGFINKCYISERTREYIKSRVRPTPWPKKG